MSSGYEIQLLHQNFNISMQDSQPNITNLIARFFHCQTQPNVAKTNLHKKDIYTII
jgi:hypothetical protein